MVITLNSCGMPTFYWQAWTREPMRLKNYYLIKNKTKHANQFQVLDFKSPLAKGDLSILSSSPPPAPNIGYCTVSVFLNPV